MLANSKENLRDLLIKFLKNEKLTYAPIKLEASFDKNWKLTDDCSYYLKSSNLNDTIGEAKAGYYQVTLKKWQFVCKVFNKTKTWRIDLVVQKADTCVLQNPKFLLGKNINLMDDSLVRNVIKYANFNPNEKKNEKRVDEHLHKKIQKESGIASSKFENQLKDSSDQKNTHSKTHAQLSNTVFDRTKNSEKRSPGTQKQSLLEPGFSCSEINFFEAITSDQFDPLIHQKCFLQQMSFNWTKSENRERIIHNTDEILDDCQRQALLDMPSEIRGGGNIVCNSKIPYVLLAKRVELNELLWGISTAVFSWDELEFPVSCFENLKQNRSLMQFD